MEVEPGKESRGRSKERKKKHKKHHKHKKKRSGSSVEGKSESRSASRGRSRSRSRSTSKHGSPSRSKSAGSRSRSESSGRNSRGRSRSRRGNSKMKSVKLKPSDWTREELMERLKKLANFQLDKTTGSGSFECINKRILADDIELFLEAMRRFNEVQKVVFRKCLITDEIFPQLNNGLKMLRHLKILDFSNNLLTRTTSNLIVQTFATAQRRLEALDLRVNNLTEEDGVQLYRAFGSIELLNSIPIRQSRTRLDSPTLTVSNAMLKLCEMGVMSSLLRDCKQVTAVDLSGNQIDSRGVAYLMAHVREMPQLAALDLSGNPLTFPDNSMLGIEEIAKACKQRRHICEVKLEGLKLPEELVSKITISTMVNRSLIGQQKGDTFESFAHALLAKTAPSIQLPPAVDIKQGFAIDFVFCRLNRIPEKTVTISGDSISILRRESRRKSDDG